MTAPTSELAVFCVMVSDLDRSTRFYRDALGFVVGATRQPNDGAIGVTGRFIQKGATIIELVQMHWEIPANGSTTPLERTGIISHIVVSCDDVAAAEAAVVACGGTIDEASRATVHLTDVGPFDFVFARDPDGFWLEICKFEPDARKRYAGLPDQAGVPGR